MIETVAKLFVFANCLERFPKQAKQKRLKKFKIYVPLTSFDENNGVHIYAAMAKQHFATKRKMYESIDIVSDWNEIIIYKYEREIPANASEVFTDWEHQKKFNIHFLKK